VLALLLDDIDLEGTATVIEVIFPLLSFHWLTLLTPLLSLARAPPYPRVIG
jgi:hypothetical protein